MNIVLVGIQWSWKWTQARLIQEKFVYHFFEMGQKLRNFTKLWLPESKQVEELISAWKLVPIELTWKIISHYLETHSDWFIIFDWVPRSINQKEMFDLLVEEYCIFYLDLDKNEAIRRLSGRRIDSITWESFSSDFGGDFNPKTWNKLITRDDDNEDSVKKRVDIFFQNTLPLLASWWKEKRKIYTIDASKNINEVFEEISLIIDRDV